MFYTDALIAPAEWPGVSFKVFSGTSSGKPTISLELSYQPVGTRGDAISRRQRLTDIANQLQGARGDVKVVLRASPLLQTDVLVTQQIIDWLYKKVIPSANVTRSDKQEAPPLILGPFLCDEIQFHEPKQFQPEVTVTRTDETLLPQPTDFPDDPTLRTIIREQISDATSPVSLAAKPSGSLFLLREDQKDEEFKRIAEVYQKNLGSAFQVRVGFLRDQFNQHELWLIPNEVFPAPPTDSPSQAVWSFATPRPLSNTLGTNDFVVPDFTKKDSRVPNWKGYPLQTHHFVDQDFDELGRAGFALIEAEAFKATVVTETANAALTKANLESKQSVANRIALFRGMGNPSYLTPVFENALTSIDVTAATRIAADAFLSNINSFYTVDTIVQLPLEKTGNGKYISVFEGKVLNPFPQVVDSRADDPRKTLPSFSDVLFKSDEKRVTLLYSVPPGTRDPNDNATIPIVDSLTIQITHIQRNPDMLTSRVGLNAFNKGLWLELATPLQLTWKGPGTCVPVAIRRFPSKPLLDEPEVTHPTLPLLPIVKNADIPVLIRWGWKFRFAVEGLTGDIVHVTVRYNEPDSHSRVSTAAFDQEWEPTTLLHCLITLKALKDHWPLVPNNDRLPILSALLISLNKQLSVAGVAAESKLENPQDRMDISFPRQPNDPPTKVSYEIMHSIAGQTSDIAPDLKRVSLVAPGNDQNNQAYLIGTKSTVNFRPSLILRRNEKIGTQPLDPVLIYECPAVEPQHETWAANSWPPSPYDSLIYQATQGQTLQAALKTFFDKLFNGASLDSIAVEVSASLQCQRESLIVCTPYSDIPIDMMPTADVADRVFRRCQDLLSAQGQGNATAPPEMDQSALRLRIKIGLKGDAVKRTLVEIAAIDFPLSKQQLQRRSVSKRRSRS